MASILSSEHFLWLCTLSGIGLCLIQLSLTFFGLDHDHDSFFDLGKFQWLSRQAFTGFLTLFGLTGLTCQKEFHLSTPLSFILALLVGILAVFLTGLILKAAKKLYSPGTVFRIEDTVGKQAIVYQRIPLKGSGKISVSIEHFTHEIEAICEEELPSFTQVQIIKKMDEKTVLVIPIK